MDAREFAAWAHGDQTYGKHPYLFHLDAVADLVRPILDPDGFLVTVAYLHDVVEDTPVTPSFVREHFGPSVSATVEYLTDPRAPNRKQRKRLLHDRLAQLRPTLVEHRAALIVKAADRCANLMQCAEDGNDKLLGMYKSEHPEFKRATMRPNLCPDIWTKIEELIAR